MQLIMVPSWLAFALAFLVWPLLNSQLNWRPSLTLQSRVGINSQIAATLVCTLLSLFALRAVQSSIAIELIELAKQKGATNAHTESQLIEPLLTQIIPRHWAAVALISSLPFFFYGLFLSSFFSLSGELGSSEAQGQVRLKFLTIEFFGVMLGQAGAAIFLDGTGSWSGLVSVLLLVGATPAILSLNLNPVRRALALIAALGLILALAPAAEPIQVPNIGLRDFESQANVVELESAWTTFSKVRTLEQRPRDPAQVDQEYGRTIVLGDGTGMAALPSFPSHFVPLQPAVAMVSPFHPKSALVLFAGAGAELISFFNERKAQNEQNHLEPLKLTGVELNPEVLRQALIPDRGVKDFLENTSSRLIESDARLYLESEKSLFDVVLFSFGGATTAHLSGTILHTTQYALTQQAMAKAWSLVAPGGVLLVLAGSKLRTLALLQEIGADLRDSTILLTKSSDRKWKRGWDNQALLVKKGPMTDDEINRVILSAARVGFELAEASRFWPHYKMAHSNSISEARTILQDVRDITGFDFRPASDDRPFVFNLGRYSIDSLESWQAALQVEPLGRHAFLIAIFVVLGVALFTIGRREKREVVVAESRIVFVLMGLATVSMLIAITYLSVLLFGNPTHALIVASLAWWCGGVVANNVRIQSSLLHWLAFLCAVAIGLFFVNGDGPVQELLSAGLLLRGGIFVLAVVMLSTVFNRPFADRMRKLNAQHFHSRYGIEALGSAMGAVAAPMFIESYGISWVARASVLLIVVILALNWKESATRLSSRSANP